MAWPTQGSRSESYSKTREQGWTSTFHRLHDICHTSSRVSLWNLPLSETFSKRIWIPMGAVPLNYIWSSEEVLEPSLLHDYLSEGPVYLQCDTSLQGLRAALLQVHGNQSRPVTYASQTQMDTEQCYACIECVIFPIVFGIKHFHTYLCRHSFNVLTDHKPLLILLISQLFAAPPRDCNECSWDFFKGLTWSDQWSFHNQYKDYWEDFERWMWSMHLEHYHFSQDDECPFLLPVFCFCSFRPKSHLLHGEDTAAVRPLNWQKRAAAAEFLRWPQGGPTSYGYILQAVGVAVELLRGVTTFFISTFAVSIRQAETKELVKKNKNKNNPLVTVRLAALSP